MLPFGGAVTFSTPAAGCVRQPDEALIHVERVRRRAGPDEDDRCDVGGVGRLDLKRAAIVTECGRDSSVIAGRSAARAVRS